MEPHVKSTWPPRARFHPLLAPPSCNPRPGIARPRFILVSISFTSRLDPLHDRTLHPLSVSLSLPLFHPRYTDVVFPLSSSRVCLARITRIRPGPRNISLASAGTRAELCHHAFTIRFNLNFPLLQLPPAIISRQRWGV